MSRVRTGHGPMDWSEPDEGVPAALSGAAYMAGEMVTGSSGSGRDKEAKAAYMKGYHARRKVDPNDYHKEHRWEGKPRCGFVMPITREECVRIEGHRREHQSRANLDADAARQRRWQERRRAA